MNQKYFKRLFPFCFLITLSFISVAQTTLSTTDQSLRYSLYARLGLKIIPIKLSDSSYKLQFVVEKIEEDASLDTYQFRYLILNSYDQELETAKKIKFSPADLIFSTERHWVFEKTIEIVQDQETVIAFFEALDTRQQDAYTSHVDLKSPFVFDQPSFGYYYANEVPFDQNYLTEGQSLLFKSGKGPSLYSFFYPSPFPIPFPPMENHLVEVPK